MLMDLMLHEEFVLHNVLLFSFQYDLKAKDISNIVQYVDKNIDEYMPSNCGLLKDVFTKRIRKMS